jgi:hypothetical protein
MPTTIKLIRGERTKVGDGIEVTFTGHTHKMVEEGETPLGVSLTVHRDGQVFDASEWVEVWGPEEARRFTAGGVTFQYLSHEYNRSMDVEVVSVGPVDPT